MFCFVYFLEYLLYCGLLCQRILDYFFIIIYNIKTDKLMKLLQSHTPTNSTNKTRWTLTFST
ncbi:Hypothetical protein Nlim_1654 [Candidatus Nitrosarchaeum limnium SFB1]|uniref:Uncharacterized protein n=1 Tax=Candidatus Nitrosarchaeum limnium SFB1 TaxID=886738 RepID=F3KMA7_9ARCH|nr:Hypothetical protein Nlim_1654 [Candidatus Nitrosarchaeum limnium SFB1]